MTLQFHPIAFGCILVVAVGTLIYTYMTTRQRPQQHGYGTRGSNTPYEAVSPLGPSSTSSKSSLPDDSGQPSSRRRNTDQCSICLGTLKASLKTLTCNHVFHTHCITTWLVCNNTCPICRQETRI